MNLGKVQKRFKKYLPFITLIFIGLVAFLLYDSLSQIQWSEVKDAITQLSASTFWIIILLSFLNYFFYSLYDFMSFRYLKVTGLSSPRIFISASICYAFNLNLGALVGGMGLRYKIYSGWNVQKSKLPWIPVVSAAISWSGYILLLCLLCIFRSVEVAKWIPLNQANILTTGLFVLSALVAYLVLCWKGKEIKIMQRSFPLPSITGAFLQFSVSSIQWCLPSVIVWVLMLALGGKVSFEQVLFMQLLAGVIGVITHIPGGLGVLETIFLRAPFNMPMSQILVALLCFRAVCYFLPLLLALPGYLFIEFYQNRHIKRTFLKRHHLGN